jgi:hypothetical protein
VGAVNEAEVFSPSRATGTAQIGARPARASRQLDTRLDLQASGLRIDQA